MAHFDLAKTQELNRLFGVPREARDSNWVQRFFEAVDEASLAALEPQVIKGPDGYPYFCLAMPPVAQGFSPFCVQHVLDHCLSQGLGIVIFSKPGTEPEYVLSFGDLWSLKSYGTFAGDPSDLAETDGQTFKTEVVGQGRQLMVGQPSETFFPGFARNAIGGFLRAAGVPDPATLLVVDAAGRPTRSLMFNFGPDNFASVNALQSFMQSLSWYFPRARGLLARADVGGSENWLAL